jgi:hypothetical protein
MSSPILRVRVARASAFLLPALASPPPTQYHRILDQATTLETFAFQLTEGRAQDFPLQ